MLNAKKIGDLLRELTIQLASERIAKLSREQRSESMKAIVIAELVGARQARQVSQETWDAVVRYSPDVAIMLLRNDGLEADANELQEVYFDELMRRAREIPRFAHVITREFVEAFLAHPGPESES